MNACSPRAAGSISQPLRGGGRLCAAPSPPPPPPPAGPELLACDLSAQRWPLTREGIRRLAGRPAAGRPRVRTQALTRGDLAPPSSELQGRGVEGSHSNNRLPRGSGGLNEKTPGAGAEQAGSKHLSPPFAQAERPHSGARDAVQGDEAERGAPQHARRAAQPLRCMLGARLDPRVATLLTSRLLSVGPMDHLPGVTAFLGGEEEEEVVAPWEVCYPELGPAVHPFRHSPSSALCLAVPSLAKVDPGDPRSGFLESPVGQAVLALSFSSPVGDRCFSVTRA